MDSVDNLTFDDVINSSELTIIDFFATWCMPCRMLKPILEKVADSISGVNFFSLDIDDNEEIAKRYRIFSVPTLLAFKCGKMIDSLVGLNSYDEIVNFVVKCNKAEIPED